ncbi:hypothetical protein HAX54_014764 [Datura stramonium]|uniref:Uncharacterized protein n=1 Tax=Datura stramonium TaxID=4076 RepID=A0ABS8TPK9_DATST|nr:hypothetical protein [Datura stramonium]
MKGRQNLAVSYFPHQPPLFPLPGRDFSSLRLCWKMQFYPIQSSSTDSTTDKQKLDDNGSNKLGKKMKSLDEHNTFLGGEFIRKSREEPEDKLKRFSISKDFETRKVCVYDTILDSGDVATAAGDVPVAAEDKNTGKNERREDLLPPLSQRKMLRG